MSTFAGDKDIHYYYLMKAWIASDNVNFNFYDAHDLNKARDSSLEASIKRQLAQRLNNAKLFIVLIGESTKYLTKFVKWEIEQAIRLDIPVIAVNLNSYADVDNSRCPPLLKNELSLHIPFKQKAVEWAIDNWGNQHASLKSNSETTPRILSRETLMRINL